MDAFRQQRNANFSPDIDAMLLRQVQGHGHEQSRPVGPGHRERNRRIVAQAQVFLHNAVHEVVVIADALPCRVDENDVSLGDGPGHLGPFGKSRLQPGLEALTPPFDDRLVLFRNVRDDASSEYVLQSHELRHLRRIRTRDDVVGHARLQSAD